MTAKKKWIKKCMLNILKHTGPLEGAYPSALLRTGFSKVCFTLGVQAPFYNPPKSRVTKSLTIGVSRSAVLANQLQNRNTPVSIDPVLCYFYFEQSINNR
jgi:hypothetical protein